MKQFLTHFKISIMLGLLLLASTHLAIFNRAPELQQNSANSAPDTIIYSAESPEETPSSDLIITDDDDPTPTPDWTAGRASQLVISAINPGYTVDGKKDVNEFIELRNLSDQPLDLFGYSLTYRNTTGNTSTILEFPDGSRLEGRTLLLRLSRRAEPGTADLTYTTAIATAAGPLSLVYHNKIVDSVCWTGGTDCYEPFNGELGKRTILVRDLEKGNFAHLESYDPEFDSDHPNLILPVVPEDPDADEPGDDDSTPSGPKQCYKLEFSEILSYYDKSSSEQFIELYNPSDNSIKLDGCSLRYKKKLYKLSGEIAAGGFHSFYPGTANLTLTKNPTTSNLIELIDADGEVVNVLEYAHGQKKQTSYAKFYDTTGEESWLLTYHPTPNDSNVYQEFRTCTDGKVINPLTGNCVKATNTASTACPAGKYRNPLTGRCKKIENSTESKACAEGYERNPETNRCRKIKTANEGANYALVPTTYTDQKSFLGIWIVLGLVLLGAIYIILQFRREIARAMRKARQGLYDFGKDLRSGKIIHRDRHK